MQKFELLSKDSLSKGSPLGFTNTFFGDYENELPKVTISIADAYFLCFVKFYTTKN